MARFKERHPLRPREGIGVRFHPKDLQAASGVSEKLSAERTAPKVTGPKFLAQLAGATAEILVLDKWDLLLELENKLSAVGASKTKALIEAHARGFRRSMPNTESKSLWLPFDEGQRAAIKTISAALRWPEAQTVLESINASLDLLLEPYLPASREIPPIIQLYQGYKLMKQHRLAALDAGAVPELTTKWTSLVLKNKQSGIFDAASKKT